MWVFLPEIGPKSLEALKKRTPHVVIYIDSSFVQPF